LDPGPISRINALLGAAVLMAMLANANATCAQPSASGSPNVSGGSILIPESSLEHPGDAGVRAHTNIGIYVPLGMPAKPAEPQSTEGRQSTEIKQRNKNGSAPRAGTQ
jgi:hypothetical protein